MATETHIVTLYQGLEEQKRVPISPRTHAKAVTDLIDAIYPVGSIYMNINYRHPAELFGGTWELISGRFLVGHGSNGVDLEVLAGQTGGEAKHTLTESEMPSHVHTLRYSTDNNSTFNVATMGKDGSHTDSSYLGVSNSVEIFTNYRASIAPTGGSQPHNNLPPYLAVYIWKRTA